MITCSREESWGRIVYDSNADEFEAHVSDVSVPLVVTRPLSVGCLVTGRCNLRCDFCYGNVEALPNVELDASSWRMLFKRLRSWGLMRVDLSGGEPTMHRDLAEIARAAVGEELQVVISTNGMVLKKGPSGFPGVRWHVSLDSGIPEIHERSRLLPVLAPSRNSLARSSQFITQCLDAGQMVRVLTCIGKHNMDALFALGEHLALLGVQDWNISRILRAGRAQSDYTGKWEIADEFVLDQIRDLRAALPFVRIRYSNRTDQNGYFLLVLPDGMLATQYTDERDKIALGHLLNMTLQDLQGHPNFDLNEHGRKWLASALEWQPDPVLPAREIGLRTAGAPLREMHESTA